MVPTRLVEALSSVRDPRVARRRLHNLVDILVIAVLATINGSTAWSDMEVFAESRLAWLRTFLTLPNGVPCEDTFRRVFEAMSPKEFGAAVSTVLEDLVNDLQGKVVALDGKTMRGSFDRRRGKSALHVVSAWVTELGLSLGQVAVDDKSNEITAIPELLKTIDVRGTTVTIDAMGCQKAIAAAIVDAGADYILAVKENQPTLRMSLEVAFAEVPGDEDSNLVEDEHVAEDHGHGRTERRRVRVISDIDWIEGIDAWKHAKSIVEVERTRAVGDKTSVERGYYISSLAVDAKTMGTRIRSHWGIENSLHWVLDVTFGEDNSRVRDRNAAANLTALRKLSLSLLKRAPAGRARSIAQRRKVAGWNPDYGFEILAGILDA
ncbi:MAG: ISAs1 family transposase [Hyphomicrobiales bacterium]